MAIGYPRIIHKALPSALAQMVCIMNENAMNNTEPESIKRSPMAGGIFIFLGLLAGVIIGIIYDQPSIGMIAGFGVGALLAVVLWVFDSIRNRG
jgi:uncharacterized membrane protein